MKIAVTGLGVVSSVGSDLDTFWTNITNGQTGIKPVPADTYRVIKTTRTGYIEGFSLSRTFDRRWSNKTDRHIQFALNAAEQAVVQSGLDFELLDKSRIHTVLGTCAGSYQYIESNQQDLNNGHPVRPGFIPGHINNMMSAYINMHYGINGSGLCIAGACAAGNQALAIAAMLIESGQADVVIAGASDSWLSEVAVGGFESLGALSFADCMPRPFDSNRDGFAISEGAGVLILESERHARQRNADVLAYLSGYGISSDAYHPTSPGPDGAVVSNMINRTLEKSNISADQIDYINAHATGTVIGDRVECQTLVKVFGTRPFISATKSMTGHSIGSTSAIEAIVSVMSIRTGTIPGTINLENVDSECPGNHLTQTIEYPVQHVLTNSFGFGGTNGVLIFSTVE